MSYKKRTEEEVQIMLKEFAQGVSIPEISKKYSISHSSFYRLLWDSRGVDMSTRKTSHSKIKKLEKTLQERDKEIALLKAALKKS